MTGTTSMSIVLLLFRVVLLLSGDASFYNILSAEAFVVVVPPSSSTRTLRTLRVSSTSAWNHRLRRPFSRRSRSTNIAAEHNDVHHGSTLSSSSSILPKKKIPIHLLAGFLGTGKTTTLKHILENKEDYKLGVLVNDVAAINIDAKLIASQSETMVELQNGCACCSLSDELLESLQQLLTSRRVVAGNQQSAAPLDAIIVELSGVADPVAIQNNWKAAVQQNLFPLVTTQAKLGNVVTVLDACTFGSDYMTFDVLQDRREWFQNTSTNGSMEECGSHRKVVELLAEQTEAADVIVVNKADMAGDEQVAITRSMAASLNDKAVLLTTSWGKVSVSQLLGQKKAKEESHQEANDSTSCTEPACTDASHSHSHAHDHGATTNAAADCVDADCTDASHSHSHAHDHGTTAVAADCGDPDCNDASHSHSHAHDHGASTTTAATDDCADPGCTDQTHTHSHSHSHSTATDNLGIVNFVYKAQRPFEAGRLMALMYQWPVPIKDELDFSLMQDAAKNGYNIQGDEGKSPFVGVLRSKGFCWFSPTIWDGMLQDTWRHNTAMYWSHAGKHLGIQEAGRWWASLDEAQMREFFVTNPAECDRILAEDFVTEEFGDRRQELVFIGVDLDQDGIEQALNECLLTDEEMEFYREEVQKIKENVMVVEAQ